MAVQSIPFTSNSGHIEAVNYDSETQDLFIQFRGSRTYVYHGVPDTDANDLSRAPSASKFIDAFIKPVYPVERM